METFASLTLSFLLTKKGAGSCFDENKRNQKLQKGNAVVHR